MLAPSRSRRGLPALVFAVVVGVLACGSAGTAGARVSSDPVVTLVVTGAGGVVVEPGEITCSATCETVVAAGTEVTVKATPSEGFVLAGWSDACAGTDGDTCVVHADADLTIGAVFAAAPVTSSTTTTSTGTAPTTTARTTTQYTPPYRPPPVGRPKPKPARPVSTTRTSTLAATPTAASVPSPQPQPGGSAVVPAPVAGGGSGPAPQPRPQPQPSRADASKLVAEAVRGLPVATVAFNTPDSLGRGETARIQLLLSPTTVSVGELRNRLSAAGRQSGARVKYSSVMDAELQSDDFEITTIGTEQKLVASDRDTEWQWEIRPKRTGQLHLFLTLNAIIDVAGNNGSYQVKTFSRTLTIRVTWTAEAADFMKGNWQWLWTAVVVPVGLWLFRRRTKPERQPERDAATHP